LILTLPGTANEDDDGYLSASEIAGRRRRTISRQGSSTDLSATSGMRRFFPISTLAVRVKRELNLPVIFTDQLNQIAV
jgi:hypothetical protein